MKQLRNFNDEVGGECVSNAGFPIIWEIAKSKWDLTLSVASSDLPAKIMRASLLVRPSL